MHEDNRVSPMLKTSARQGSTSAVFFFVGLAINKTEAVVHILVVGKRLGAYLNYFVYME